MGKKISELSARTALSNNDIFVVVDEPGTGSAETAKVTYTTLRDSIIAEAGFNTVGNDQILDPASAGGNVTINASATVNGDFTVSGNTVIDTGSQIVSDTDNPIIINPGGTGDTIIESELITNGPITANSNLSVNGDFSVTGTITGIGLLDLDMANTSKIADGTAGQLLQTDGAGNFKFVQGASTKGAFTDGSGVSYDDQQYDITGITQANPAVMTVESGHNLVNGDSITITTVTGMTEVNDQTYFVSVSGDDLTLYSDSGLTTQINSTGFSSYLSGGVADSGDGAFVPGSGAETSSIDILSDVDTTTNTPTSGDGLKWDGTNWVPVASATIDPAMTPTDGQALVWDDQQYAITGATQANPVVITLPTDHNLTNGDAIAVTGVGGMTELNGVTFYASVGASGAISLYSDTGLTTPIDGTSYSAYTSGGSVNAGSGNWVANAAASSVGTLTDVDTAGLANGQILKYNSGNTTWTPMSTGDLLGSDDSVPSITWRDTAITNAHMQDGDMIVWDSQQYDITNITAGTTTMADIPGHNYSNGDIVTITSVTGMTEINSQVVYVRPLTQNGVSFYTDEAQTTGLDSTGFSTYTAPSGVATGQGTWRINRGQPMDGSSANTVYSQSINTTLDELSDVDLSSRTNDRKYLAYDPTSGNYEAASASDIISGGSQIGMTGGDIYIDPDNITEGQTLTWVDQQYDIISITESGNQLYVDLGANAHATDQLGIGAWVVFDMSAGAGAQELHYQSGIWHFLSRVNNDPSISTLYGVSTGNIFSSDTLTQYLATNTSPWTSGGKIVKVDGNGANTHGAFIATNGSSSSSAAILAVSDAPPSTPDDGALWWESDTGRLKLYYNDGSSSQWVDAFTASAAADKNIFNSTTQEKTNVVTSAGSGGKDYDCSGAGIHHLSNITGDIDANLTNLSLDTGYSTTVTFVLNQTTNAKVVKTLSIGGSSQTINWVGGVVPTGTASAVDAMSFSIIRTGASAYTVLGQLVPFS